MLEVTNYKPINKGALVGTFAVRIPSWNFFINDISLFQKEGRRWLSMPSRSYEKDGQTKYFSYCGLVNKESHERFQDAALKALDRWFIEKAKEAEAKGELKSEMTNGQGQEPIINSNDDVPF